MKRFISIIAIVFFTMVPSGYSLKKTDYRDARLKNVCKDLIAGQLHHGLNLISSQPLIL
jgi:hypothetical protein